MNKRSLRNIFALALLLPMAQLTVAADSKPSVESFFKDPEIQSVELSPKGHYVAILSRGPEGGQVLAVRDTADLKKLTVPAAEAPNADEIVHIHWINENRIGITLKNLRIEFEGNLDEFAVDRDGSNLTHLISGSWNHHQENVGSNIKEKVLTADYGFFSAMHDGSDDIIVEKYIFNNVDMHAHTSRLYRLNTRTRQLSDLLEGKQPEKIYHWMLDADDVPRIALSQSKGRCVTSYLAPDSKDWTEINNSECLHDTTFSPTFFDGPNSMLVTASYKGHEALFRYDLKTKKMESEPLVSIQGFDFNGSSEIDENTKKVLGIHYDGDAKSTIWFDPKFKDLQKKIDNVLKQTNNHVTCGSDCLNSPVVLVTSSSDRQPTQYFIYTTATGAIVGLGGSHPDIKPAQMGLRDFYHYPARDGLSIPVYVTIPPGKSTEPRPTVVLVHGGPNVRGSSWAWESEAQFLASRGYVVIQPEYRGSTGFGFAHFQAGWKQWGRSMQDDLADAATWSIQKGWSDPKRIAIMGASYGGYATLMGLIKNPEIFRCGVDWAGVTDIELKLGLAESDASQEYLNYGAKTLVGDPATDAAIFKENSPLVNAAKLTQPLLIAHGAQDRRVPIAQATAFRSAVSKNNSNVEWIVYSNEGHGWRHEENNIDFWKHVEVFLEKNLR
jgi:dipeptidyl aminopeptidase/acylaminoacyl peptidase